MLSERVLFIDGEALVIDKPAGLPVDAPRAGGASVEALAGTLRFDFQRPPAAVHRIDRDTSGCLLLARNPKVHKRLAAAFESGAVEKRYLAVLDGLPEGTSGRIELPLAKVSSREAGWRMVADPRGKPAVTEWRLLGAVDGRALIEFHPLTGRTHQLRVHAATGLGHAIAGDPVYGRGTGEGMMLHAWRLTVAREAKPAIAAVAPLPARFGVMSDLVPSDG